MRELFRSWAWLLGLAVVLIAPVGRAAQDSPSAEAIVRKVIERAESQRAKASAAIYLCMKQTVSEELDSSGQVVARKVNLHEALAHPSGTRAADKWGSKNGVTMNEDLLRRYKFTLVRREKRNGRSTFRLDFVPKQPAPPVRQFQDRLLNRAEGTVWVDDQEYELVKASFHLGGPVSFGILGGVEALQFSFERLRKDEGDWLTIWTDTYFKGRKFLKSVQTRKRVEYSEFKKGEQPSAQPTALSKR